MAMSQSTMATELENLVPSSDEAQAAQTLADAYAVYCTDAESNGVPITPAAVEAGKAAMVPALGGMSAPGAGAAAWQAGMAAFWTAIAPLLSGAFAGATAITPPPLAGLSALLVTEFAAITAAADDLPTAAAKLAKHIHAQTLIGGTATFPGPVTAPII